MGHSAALTLDRRTLYLCRRVAAIIERVKFGRERGESVVLRSLSILRLGSVLLAVFFSCHDGKGRIKPQPPTSRTQESEDCTAPIPTNCSY